MPLTISRERCVVTLLIIGYLFLIGLGFEGIGNQFSSVEGYNYRGLSFTSSLLGGCILLFTSFFLPLSRTKVSTFVVWIVFYFHIIPTVLLFDAVIDVGVLRHIFYVFFVSISFSLVGVGLRVKIPSISFLKVSDNIVFFISLIACAFPIFILYRDFGFKFSAPSIYDVYGVRSEYKSSASGLVGYFSILIGYFFSPMLIFLGIILFRKSKFFLSMIFIGLAFFMSYQVFAITGFKSVAFMLVVVIAYAAVLMKYKRASHGLLVSSLFLGLIVFAFALSSLLGFDDLLFHWVRRALISPGVNSLYFYEYELLNGFGEGVSAPNVISKSYYGTDGSANTGIIGDGVFKYGALFFWINCLVFLFYMKALDFFVGKNNKMVAALFLPAAYALANSSISTVLLTYGFVPMILFTFLFRKFMKNA